MKISASIVIYNDNKEVYERAIDSFISACEGTLVVVDNSEGKSEFSNFSNERIEFIKTSKNIGFGAGHNLALKKINFGSDVHFIINPDVIFNGVINEIASLFSMNKKYGVVMPSIIYPDGTPQNLCKLLPTPIDLFIRRFINSKKLESLISPHYVLMNLDHKQNIRIPSLSGCFLAVRTEILKEINGFDERFFLYMEDIDLVRRIGERYDTIYCPTQNVTHNYRKGSYKNKKLFLLHLRSAISYFNKYGWFIDKYRTRVNKQTLLSLRIK
mgnify:CR=1 FL=1